MDISQHIQIASGYLPEQTIAQIEICTKLCIPELQKASIQTALNTLLHAMQIPIITTAEFDRNFYSEFYLNGFWWKVSWRNGEVEKCPNFLLENVLEKIELLEKFLDNLARLSSGIAFG